MDNFTRQGSHGTKNESLSLSSNTVTFRSATSENVSVKQYENNLKKLNENDFQCTNLRPKDIGKFGTSPKKMKKRRNSDTSSDEERWLNAIETGNLADVDDEMKKLKDPKLMTARQRAMHKRAKESFSGFEEELIALPSGYKEKDKPQTEEDIKRATLKSQKRKQQADERREKDKKKTMDRLLKKQETNKHRPTLRNKQCQKSCDPKLIYVSSKGATYILIPPNQEFPMKAQKSLLLPPPKLCFVAHCGNPKAYTCSKTKVPLCSLVCYRKNLLGV